MLSKVENSEKLEIVDISVPLSTRLPFWPGDEVFSRTMRSIMETGDDANVSFIQMSVHTGTHVDAPLHFIGNGKPIQELALDVLFGPALVVENTECEHFDSSVFESASIPSGTERLLLKSRNSSTSWWLCGEFDTGYAAITKDGAEWLRSRGIRLVGVDYLSVAPFADLVSPHQVLLGAGIIVVEGLRLQLVEPGTWMLACLPLLITDAEGAPARAVLWKRNLAQTENE